VTAELSGRRVLVTGGSHGIGRAVTTELARHGARLVVAAREPEALAEAVRGLTGSHHQSIVLDVSDAAAWSAAERAIDAGGEVHGLVTAAGVPGPIGALEDLDPADIGQAIAINLIGTMLALRFAIPRLRRTGGRAVTFSGGGATSPLPRYDAYAASKAAVVRLTENIAAGAGIELNAVAPGFIATRMHDATLKAGAQAAGEAYLERTRAELSAGGFPASEAAELVCFLLSDAAAGINGRLISAQWDPWRDDSFRARLRTDPALGTLRRIDDQFFTAKPRP
jgi:NAD(P)-dependent dehydrogenase (short-subunit alcohol dehydrogenase family)